MDCGLRRVRHHGELRRVLRPRLPGGGGRDRSRARASGVSERSASSTACATGASRANATGAVRFPSSTARGAVRCRCRTRSCRWCCPRTWCPTAAATRCAKYRRVLPVPLSEVRRTPRGARPTPWTPSSTRRGTTCATPARTQHTAMIDAARRLLAAGRSVHRRHRARDPAPAVFALLDARDARFRHARVQRAVHAAAHPGHGAQPRLLLPARRRSQALLQSRRGPGAARSRRARDLPGGNARSRHDHGRARGPGQDVEVGEQRRRPARGWSSASAPTPRGCSSCSPRHPSRRSSGPTTACRVRRASCGACGSRCTST